MAESIEVAATFFTPEHIYPPSEDFHLEETSVAGAGKTVFKTELPSLVLKASDSAPLLWALKNRKCAEGAVIVFRNEQRILYVLEMKSGLTSSAWQKALKQCEGMYLTALASARLIGILDFDEVYLCIAYKSAKLTAETSGSPVLLKTFVGQRNPLGGALEWEAEKVTLPIHGTAKILKQLRDADGNAEFKLN